MFKSLSLTIKKTFFFFFIQGSSSSLWMKPTPASVSSALHRSRTENCLGAESCWGCRGQKLNRSIQLLLREIRATPETTGDKQHDSAKPGRLSAGLTQTQRKPLLTKHHRWICRKTYTVVLPELAGNLLLERLVFALVSLWNNHISSSSQSAPFIYLSICP